MKSVEEIMGIASAAITEANKIITTCATRYTEIEQKTPEGKYISMVNSNEHEPKSDAELKLMIDSIENKRHEYKSLADIGSMEDFYEAVTKVQQSQAGNCDELSLLAAAYIFEKYPDLKPYVGIYKLALGSGGQGIPEPDHVFIVIAPNDLDQWDGGNPKGSEDIVICDPLYQSVYLDTDLPKKLRCTKINPNEGNIIAIPIDGKKWGFASSYSNTNLFSPSSLATEATDAVEGKEAEKNDDLEVSDLIPSTTSSKIKEENNSIFSDPNLTSPIPSSVEAEKEVVAEKKSDLASSNAKSTIASSVEGEKNADSKGGSKSLTSLPSYQKLFVEQIKALERRKNNPAWHQDLDKIDAKLKALQDIKKAINGDDSVENIYKKLKDSKDAIKDSTRQRDRFYPFRGTVTSDNLYDKFIADIEKKLSEAKLSVNEKKPHLPRQRTM